MTMTTTAPIDRLQSRLRSVLSQAKREYELHDEVRMLNDDHPEHLSAMLECEAALQLLPESVAGASFVSQDVATEYARLLGHYVGFLNKRGWIMRARMVTGLMRDIEESCGDRQTAA